MADFVTFLLFILCVAPCLKALKSHYVAYYHCVSRVVNRAFVFGAAEKEKFVEFMRTYERLYGLRVLAYCIMSNHFHVLVEVPQRPSADQLPSDTGLVALVRATLGDKIANAHEWELEHFRKMGTESGNETAEAIRERWFSRMWDVSTFMKVLKQRFTQWFNGTHQRRGTLWEDRFRSSLVEGKSAVKKNACPFITDSYNDHSEVSYADRRTTGGTIIGPTVTNYNYDGIGNRSYITSSLLGTRVYSANSRNQYGSMTLGGALGILGRADSSWTIQYGKYSSGTLGTTTTASRIGDMFYGQVTSSTKTYQKIAVRRDTGSPTYDRYLWFPGASTAPTYDFDGNLTGDDRWVYTWDAENRLIKMETTAAAVTAGMSYTKLTFAYDWEGHRLARTAWVGGTSSSPTFSNARRWVYDGWNPIAEFSAAAETSGTLTRLNTFTWGLDLADQQGIPTQKAGGVGGLLYQTTVATGVIEKASYDGNGNVVSWTKSTATNPTYRCEYDAFGNTVVAEGSAPSSYGFSTKMQDAQTGLYYYGYRYYNAVDGRWINRDPIAEKGGVNLFGFVGNDGVNFYDKNGLIKSDAFIKRQQDEKWSIYASLEGVILDCSRFDEESIKTDVDTWTFDWTISNENSTLRSYKKGECATCYEYYTKRKVELSLGIGQVSASLTDIYIEMKLVICYDSSASSSLTYLDEAKTSSHDGFATIDHSNYDYNLSANGIVKSGSFYAWYKSDDGGWTPSHDQTERFKVSAPKSPSCP